MFGYVHVMLSHVIVISYARSDTVRLPLLLFILLHLHLITESTHQVISLDGRIGRRISNSLSQAEETAESEEETRREGEWREI